MDEVRDLGASLQPVETLFVVDSMAGQDAVNAARAFGAALTLTGVVLTKADGDARGGAALSVRQVTGQPILFVGIGEKPDALEAFQPERMASRILGMGDVLALVEEVTREVDREEAEKLARKMAKGKDFDLDDLLGQLRQLEQHGRRGGPASTSCRRSWRPRPAQMPQGNEKEVKRPDRDHLLDDARRAALPEEHRRLTQAPDRGWVGHAGVRDQPAAQELPADAEDDEGHGQGRPRPDAALHGRPAAAGPPGSRLHKHFFSLRNFGIVRGSFLAGHGAAVSRP